MTVRLGPLAVDAVEPRAVENFCGAALGGPAQHALLSFRRQRRLELGARVLAEYRPQRGTLADVCSPTRRATSSA